MVRESEIIQKAKDSFDIIDSQLFWKKGTKKYPKKAGYTNIDGYIEVSLNFGYKNNKKFLAHRIIFAIHYGYLPKLVDHIDRKPNNNSISNLRDASKRLNSINTGLSSNNKSGHKGVYFNKGAFCAFIGINKEGKKYGKHLGRFKTIEEAIEARVNAEKQYWNDI